MPTLEDARRILLRHRLDPWHPQLGPESEAELLEALNDLAPDLATPAGLSPRQRTDLHKFLAANVRALRTAERAIAGVLERVDSPGPWATGDMIVRLPDGTTVGANLHDRHAALRATLAGIREQLATYSQQLGDLKLAPPKRMQAQAFDKLVRRLVDYFDGFFDDRRRLVAFLQSCWQAAGGPDRTDQNFRDALRRIDQRTTEVRFVRRMPDDTIAHRHVVRRPATKARSKSKN
jgi:hypothetical protein